MELREYYKILKSNISMVAYAVIIAVLAVYAWSVRVSETYSSSLLLNISRADIQAAGSDYRFDQFYRVSADEKFSETVTEWLKNSGVNSEILDRAGINREGKTLRQLSKGLRVSKLAPEIVEVGFSAPSREDADKIREAIEVVIAEKVKTLNGSAKDAAWFSIHPTNFITAKNNQDLRINLSVAVLFGLLFGSLAAFGKHYISE